MNDPRVQQHDHSMAERIAAMVEGNLTKITIRRNEFDEYEVPTPDVDHIYYTDDKDDAIGTAIAFHGTDVEITHRRGTYNREG